MANNSSNESLADDDTSVPWFVQEFGGRQVTPDRWQIMGHYFLYCQVCQYDGQCELTHCQFLGMESSGQVDQTPYPGHENLEWHFSGFQRPGCQRAACGSRILYSDDSLFYPLFCECGTVISSLTFSSIFGGGICAKLKLNARGELRLEVAKAILARRGASFDQRDQLTSEELKELEELVPEDENYQAATTR